MLALVSGHNMYSYRPQSAVETILCLSVMLVTADCLSVVESVY